MEVFTFSLSLVVWGSHVGKKWTLEVQLIELPTYQILLQTPHAKPQLQLDAIMLFVSMFALH